MQVLTHPLQRDAYRDLRQELLNHDPYIHTNAGQVFIVRNDACHSKASAREALTVMISQGLIKEFHQIDNDSMELTFYVCVK